MDSREKPSKGSFWKGFALGMLGLLIWVFFSILEGVARTAQTSAFWPFVGIGFFLMLAGPALFWLLLPLKGKWYDRGAKAKFFVVAVPVVVVLAVVLVITFTGPTLQE